MSPCRVGAGFLALGLGLGGLAHPVAAQRTMHAPLAAQLPLGARALAMGGSTAGGREAEGALGNPALAGGSTGSAVNGSQYGGGARAGVMGVGTAAGSIGVAMAVSYLDYGVLGNRMRPVRLRDDVVLGDGAESGASMVAAVALSASWKGLRWGAAASYLEERIIEERGSGAALSVGAAKDGLFGGMTLGLAVQNVGPSLDIGPLAADLPTRVSLGFSGLSLPISAYWDFTATGNVAVRRDGLVTAGAGVEFAWVPIEGISVALRSGVRAAELSAQRPWTNGVGINFDRLAVDYAWEQLRSGGAHRIGLRLR